VSDAPGNSIRVEAVAWDWVNASVSERAEVVSENRASSSARNHAKGSNRRSGRSGCQQPAPPVNQHCNNGTAQYAKDVARQVGPGIH
jgi:hypothetical protein